MSQMVRGQGPPHHYFKHSHCNWFIRFGTDINYGLLLYFLLCVIQLHSSHERRGGRYVLLFRMQFNVSLV